MKILGRRSSDVRLETRPGESPSELEELGKVIVFTSLIMLGFIGLAVFVLYLQGW